MSDRPIFSRPINVNEIPDAGTIRTITGDPSERAALAADLGLQAIDSLSAEVALTPRGRREIALEGTIKAEIVQTCVVSLVPVPQTVEESFSLRLLRGPREAATPKPHAEIQIDPDAPEPPEVLAGNTIDLGEIVTEHFVLGIDPYPRAPGAELPPEAADPGDSKESPFAALASLKKGRKRPG